MNIVEFSEYLRKNHKLTESPKGRTRSTMYGVGINDADYLTQPYISGKGVVCPAYRAWADMMKRSYSENFHKTGRSYIDVTVSNDWHSFMNFRSWWMVNAVDGWALDKDIINPGNRVYSKESCIYLPQEINSFISERRSNRGAHPVGSSFELKTNSLLVKCRNPITRKNENLGRFKDPELALIRWKNRKIEIANELIPMMDEIDLRIHAGILEIIRRVR